MKAWTIVVLVGFLCACASDETTSLTSTSPTSTSTTPSSSIVTTTPSGGTIAVARTTVTASDDAASVRIVSQNILHGLGCADGCRLDERVGLFVQQLQEAGCPEVVGIQEANADVVAALAPRLDACGYELVWDGDPGIDRELALTTLKVVDSRRTPLVGGFRSALAIRLDAEFGALDLVATHLAAGDDNGRCGVSDCPPPCVESDSFRECQARQVVELARSLSTPGGVTVIGGDLNARPGEPAYAIVTEEGFVDSHRAANRPDCGPDHPESCTAGRDTTLDDLANPRAVQRARIDYLFLDVSAACAVAGSSGPFNPAPADGEIAWPSDHTGVLLELRCHPSAAAHPFPTTETSTSVAGTGAPPGIVDDVATAFETFFDGSADPERRLEHLERGEELRASFLAQIRAAGDSAASTRARVDSVTVTSTTTADVVFTILLDDTVVFDRRAGTAVFEDGDWLVSTETFCDLATLTSADSACVSPTSLLDRLPS